MKELLGIFGGFFATVLAIGSGVAVHNGQFGFAVVAGLLCIVCVGEMIVYEIKESRRL